MHSRAEGRGAVRGAEERKEEGLRRAATIGATVGWRAQGTACVRGERMSPVPVGGGMKKNRAQGFEWVFV